PLVEGEVRVLCEVGPRDRVPVQVVERDDLVVVDEPPRERRRDEPGAARHEDALAAQGHAASLTTANAFPRLAGALQVTATVEACAWPGPSSRSPRHSRSRARPPVGSPRR